MGSQLYGLRTYDENGVLLVDVSARLNRFRHSEEVAAAASGNVVLSDIDGQDTVELSMAVNPDGLRRHCHQVSRSGTTINWAPQTYSDNQCDSLILIFFYV